MKHVVVLVLLLAFSTPAFAQGHPLTNEAEDVYSSGTLKMIAGWASIGAGSAMVGAPLGGGMKAACIAMMGGGGYLVYLGGKQRGKAMHMPRPPSLTFGFIPLKKGFVGGLKKSW